MVKAGQPAERAFAAAGTGIAEALGPDRLVILKVQSGKAAPVARHFVGDLAPARRKTMPYSRGLVACIRSRAPVIENRLPPQDGAADPLGSMLCVPSTEGTRIVGLLYLDSFADNPQAYIQEDADFLVKIAAILTPVFAG